MKNKVVKRVLATALVAVMAVSMLAGCGGKGGEDKGGSSDGKTAEFGWWIYKTDAEGQYYEDYNEVVPVQWIENQVWDTENGGISKDGKGTKLDFSFTVPIAGSEKDNFNTMMATGEYPEILDTCQSTDSPQTLCENGQTLDLTEYVEKYMPNYLAYLDANPELKPFVQVKDDEGEVHYYAIYALLEGAEDPWQGYGYRRDWVVKYAVPSEYVWDWESDEVKENGHPAVTPLEKAIKEKNLDGWKKNDVTSFTANYQADTETGYEDNVIFPSGKSDPITISDWEWMFEAFDKAITERGWAEDSNSYCISVYYQGFMQTGDLVSSFGGGTGQYYVKEGEVSFDGDSENFKAYLECLNNWYEKGWLDSEFNTRASDRFFAINSAGNTQGKVGMWDAQVGMIGESIRPTCINEEDAKDAYVMAAALPINDTYGGKEQMFKEPDAMFQTSRVGTGTVITTKAEDRSEEEMAALFTFLDWTYTREGAMVMRTGLNEEQYASMEFDPDLYAEYDLDTSYTTSKDEDGRTMYTRKIDVSNNMVNAVNAQRMDVGIKPNRSDEYWVNTGAPAQTRAAYEQWTKYVDTGSALNYVKLLSPDESDAYNKISNAILDYQQINTPGVIKGTMTFEDYVKGMESIDPDSAVEYLQKYVDLANSAK